MLTEETKPAGPVAAPTAEVELAGGTQVTFARSDVTDQLSGSGMREHSGFGRAPRPEPGLQLPIGHLFHTCMCELTEGEVEYLDEPLDPPDPGHVLICCATPKTNLVLEV